jgi:hypothetical protein
MDARPRGHDGVVDIAGAKGLKIEGVGWFA